jgi:hypothetical protein
VTQATILARARADAHLCEIRLAKLAAILLFGKP